MDPISEREQLYKLILGQLRHDGYESLAHTLGNMVFPNTHISPTARLQSLVRIAIEAEGTGEYGTKPSAQVGEASRLDFDAITEDRLGSKAAPDYKTIFVTSHKGSCRAAAFSMDGRIAATASADMSIKVLDVSKMAGRGDSGSAAGAAQAATMMTEEEKAESKPVLRTLYDHLAPINCLAFHPHGRFLASGSQDRTVKFFDHVRLSSKRSMRAIQESHNCRTLSFHPAGNHLLLGTDHPVIRLYDVNTFQCYAPSNALDHHKAAVTCVAYAPKGNMYASCSKDGAIKLWDGIGSRCINTFAGAHDNAEVYSLAFSENGKYLLSNGRDSRVRLWEVTSGRVIHTYEGAVQTPLRTQCAFSYNEDYVLVGDEASSSVVMWDSRSGERLKTFSGHTAPIRAIATTPESSGFMTSGEDCRMRYWAIDIV
eukprot:Opistho-2@61798